jgi:hypothetical protein
MDFELLISDNTQGKLVLSNTHLQDPRVRQIIQSKRLSMGDHWRELLEISSGEWTCFMGADDGIVSENLTKLLRVLSVTERNVVSTHRIEIDFDQNFCASVWTFPATQCSESVTEYYWPTWLSSLFPHFFFDLPMPYNKAVFRTEVLSGFLKNKFKFYDLTPDYFLAFLLAKTTKLGVYLDLPIFVHGGSEHSNGYQYTTGNITDYSNDFLSRIDSMLQFARKLPKDCQSGWLANSYLLSIFTSKNLEAQSWISTAQRRVISKFYEVWVASTCISCTTHANRNSRLRIQIKLSLINKVASFIRNYVLPLRAHHSIPFHQGIRKSGASEIKLENLGRHIRLSD